MATTKIVCETTAEFEGKLAEAQEEASKQSRPLIILFTGAVNPETGKSWCPDCVAADPVIHKCLGELEGGSVLLEIPVLREEYRGNADYPYRKHPLFGLKCVPTLIKFDNGKALYSLDDSQSQDEILVRTLLSS